MKKSNESFLTGKVIKVWGKDGYLIRYINIIRARLMVKHLDYMVLTDCDICEA